MVFSKRSSLRSQTFLSFTTLHLAYPKLVGTPCFYLECLLNFDLGDLLKSSLWRVVYRSRWIRRIRSWGLGELRTSLIPVNEVLLEYSVVIPSKSDNSLRSVSDKDTVGKTNVKGWSPRTTDSLCSLITLDFEVLLFEFLLTLKKKVCLSKIF